MASEGQLKMSETTPRVMEVRAIAELLWFLPPPGRMMIGDKLHGLGLRAHPELAELQLEREGPAALGNHAPQRVVRKTSMQEGMEALRKIDPALAERIDAAKTEQQRADLGAELKAQITPEALASLGNLVAGS